MSGFPMFVVFDLDGTLALNDHRNHFIEREVGQKDWRSYFAACDRDEPCLALVRTLTALTMAGHDVEIWTGRSAEVADKTTTWLAANGLGHVRLRSREIGDHRADTVLKEEWLAASSRKPDLVFEDRASVVAMWRSRGILCAQVAPGEF